MPRLILDYLKSMACHSAVKFGDPLTLAECKSIVGQLSKCELPFQCAHGRPSILPVLKIVPERPTLPSNTIKVAFKVTRSQDLLKP
jgi:DNA mismatch repair protein MLH3